MKTIFSINGQFTCSMVLAAMFDSPSVMIIMMFRTEFLSPAELVNILSLANLWKKKLKLEAKKGVGK